MSNSTNTLQSKKEREKEKKRGKEDKRGERKIFEKYFMT